MPRKNDPSLPSYKSDIYLSMARNWYLVDRILQGTEAVREAGSEFLPQFPAEHDDVYYDRLATATFYNAYAETLDGITGLVFRREPKLGEDVHKVLREHFENIDLAGTAWHVFLREVLYDACHLGHAFIVVDQPRGKPKPGGVPRTYLDDIEDGIRPYWILYGADQAINWLVEKVRGREVLTRITFREEYSIPDGYAEMTRIRYRVWFLNEEGRAAWELWEAIDPNDEEDVVKIDEGETRLRRLPVAGPIYGCRARPRMWGYSRPTLLDLAHLNIKHYQKQSDYDHSLHIAGVPILFATGRDPTQKFQPIGLSTLVDLPPNCTLGYAEPKGAALAAARTNLQDLEAQIRDLGLSLVIERGEVMSTATEQVMRAARRASKLTAIVQSLFDAAEQAAAIHCEYLGIPPAEGGTIVPGASFEDLVLNPQEVIAYADMVRNKELSLSTLWAMLQRSGRLADDFDPEKEIEKIRAENEALADIRIPATQGPSGTQLSSINSEKGPSDGGE